MQKASINGFRTVNGKKINQIGKIFNTFNTQIQILNPASVDAAHIEITKIANDESPFGFNTDEFLKIEPEGMEFSVEIDDLLLLKLEDKEYSTQYSNNRLYFIDGEDKFAIKVHAYEMARPKIPDYEPIAKIKVAASKLESALMRGKTISDFLVLNNGRLYVKGDDIGFNVLLDKNDTLDRVAVYPMEYLYKISKNIKGDLTILYDDDYPCLLKWNECGTEFMFMLAPRIEEMSSKEIMDSVRI